MKKPLKHLQFLILGTFLLSSSVFAAANECYSLQELNDFKALYIKLQNELNYEGKDAYLDKNSQVQLKPHAKDAPYPGKEFEAALFGEYQNALRKVGKLYQNAKFEDDDSFKSNELLVNFMKAIDDKSSDSSDFINKTKIKDVLNALEDASVKKYGKSSSNSDKKYMLNAGDKYLIEKLLIHTQDRLCSVSKFEETNKGTSLFKADYLQKIKNAPLNLLVNTIKNAPIEKDSKIDLKQSSPLTASLVDPTIAINSAITDNLNQLSAWVKKVQSKGPKCLAAIKSKSFANKIQGQIQGCNFGHFVETLSRDNVNNLESVLHFINANEKLLNQNAAKAETSLDELKLEGFISKAFDNLGTEVKCTQLDSANAGDKKVFIRNLPYNEKTNQFDSSSILCKSKNKGLSFDACKKQYDLISDPLGRGLEIKPKKGASSNMTFSVKESASCAGISFLNPNQAAMAVTEKSCIAQLKDDVAFIWDPKNRKCSEQEISKVSSIEQCVALRKEGSVFNWDAPKKECLEFSALMSEAALKQSAQMCEVKKKDGFSFKWNAENKNCDESSTQSATATALNKIESIQQCMALKKTGSVFNWDATKKECKEFSALMSEAALKQSVQMCEVKKKDGSTFTWNAANKACDELLISSANSIEQCMALKKPGSVFNWDAPKKECKEFSALTTDAALKQSAQMCEVKKKDGFSFKWNAENKNCEESSAHSTTATALNKIESIQQCMALKKTGSVFNWDPTKKECKEFSALTTDAALKQSVQMCEVKKKDGSAFTWNATKKACDELLISNANSIEQCVALKKTDSVFNWDATKKECKEFSALKSDAVLKQSAQMCEVKKKTGFTFKWDAKNKNCEESPILSTADIKSKEMCESKKTFGMAFKWNASNNACESSPILTIQEQKIKEACIAKSFKWDTQNKKCDSSSLTTASSESASNSGSTKNLGSNNNLGDSVTLPKERTPATANAGSYDDIKLTSGNNSQKPTNTGSNSSQGTTNTGSNSSQGSTNTGSSSSQGSINTGSNSSQGSTLENGLSQEQKSDSTPPLSGLALLHSIDNEGAEKLKCENKKLEGFAFRWMPDSKKCLQTDAAQAKLDCDNTKKEGFEYQWNEETLKCLEIDLKAKETCESQKKEGLAFTWDAVKEICKKTKEEKKEVADTTLAEAEKQCEIDNAKWVEEKNDGRPGIKWEWDGKVCKDKRPAKETAKNVVEEEVSVQEEAPLAPKRAPARFVPINIPSRQIYLMPGMP